jgi:DNA-binding NtrC family response regulator
MDTTITPGRPFQKLRLLIIDDDAELTEFLGAALTSEFSLVMVASGIAQAKSLIDGPFVFHTVVCDYFLPDGSGMTLYNWLRKERNSMVPFLMISGRMETIKSKDPRFLFLSKPFSPEGLLTKLSQFKLQNRLTGELRTRP